MKSLVTNSFGRSVTEGTQPPGQGERESKGRRVRLPANITVVRVQRADVAAGLEETGLRAGGDHESFLRGLGVEDGRQCGEDHRCRFLHPHQTCQHQNAMG
eukprot:2166144-Prymnesium_polylepis.1